MNNLAVILEFELRALWNDKPGLLRMLTEPLAYLFLFTAGLGGTFATSLNTDNYMSFVYPGIIVLQGFRVFVHSLYRLTIDRRWGLQAIKMVAGTSRLAYLIGHAVVPILLCLIQIVITLPCAYLLGVSSPLKNCFLLAITGIVIALFWTMVASTLTFYIKKYSQRDFLINFLFLPLSFSAPIFYSMEKAPHYLQAISLFNPLTYQVNAMRDAFLFGTISLNFYFLLIILAFFLILAMIALSKSEFLPAEIH